VGYITSDELGDVTRLGLVFEMEFTLDDICDSWARVMCGDRLTDVKLPESRQQVVRFICWKAFIEPVDLEVFVFVVRTALESSLRNCNVLVGHFVNRGLRLSEV